MIEKNEMIWNFYSKKMFFRNEWHYFFAQSLFLVLIIFLFKCININYENYYFLIFSECISKIFPGMQTIMSGGYDEKTKLFYAIYYLFSPLFFLNGLLASFFISPKRYEILIVRCAGIKLLVIMLFSFFLAVLPLAAPMIGFSGPIITVIFNTIMTSGLIYLSGRMLVAFIIKSKLSD